MDYPLPMRQVEAAHPIECQTCKRTIRAGEVYYQRVENSEIVRQCTDCRPTYKSL